jgi:hypothetical protein
MSARRLLVALVTLSLFALVPLAGHPRGAAAQTAPAHRTISVTGLKQAGANDVLLDLTLDIPPGADPAAIVADALARRGAQPFTRGDPRLPCVTPAFHWPQFFDHDKQPSPVPQSYNPAGDPVPGGALQALQADEAAWTAVPAATYAVQYAGTTTRGEAFDGVNTVSWPAQWQDGPNALAVTITTLNRCTGDILDADIIINSQNFQFFANPADLTPTRFDIRYILLHENGHVAGLGHSPDPAAVMYPFFDSGIVGHGLAQPDIDALSTLYPLQFHTQPPPVPFSATLSGITHLNLAAFSETYGGSGTGTAVGASQVHGGAVVFPVSPTCFVASERVTIIAANGDQLSLSFEDLSCNTAAAPFVYDVVSSYRVSGGTGRFAGARGNGSVVSHRDFTTGFATGTYTLTFSGAIAYSTLH